jgi:hypothetical protein
LIGSRRECEPRVPMSGAQSPIVELCGVRTESCPPGMKTGDQISPPLGYVGGGLQMQTDLAIGPAGDVWVMDKRQDVNSCFGTPPRNFRRAVAARASPSFSLWPNRCARRRSARLAPRGRANNRVHPIPRAAHDAVGCLSRISCSGYLVSVGVSDPGPGQISRPPRRSRPTI